MLALIAGWRSWSSRQAHNLKIAGSNPAPATLRLAAPGGYRLLAPSDSAGGFSSFACPEVSTGAGQMGTGLFFRPLRVAMRVTPRAEATVSAATEGKAAVSIFFHCF